jgi:hypothetical protein
VDENKTKIMVGLDFSSRFSDEEKALAGHGNLEFTPEYRNRYRSICGAVYGLAMILASALMRLHIRCVPRFSSFPFSRSCAMKHLSIPTLLMVALAAAHPAVAAPKAIEFQLDESYSALAPEAGDEPLATDEIDPNIIEGLTEPAVESPASPRLVQEAPPAPPAAVKPAKVIKVKEPEPREIPLIEPINETQSSPDITYVTGGIGDDERQAIEAAKADYNLHVMSASLKGAFVGDARVIISRKKGAESEEMLNVVAGPLLYVRLPAGNYTLDASLGEQKKHQSFTVTKKGAAARIHLGWKVPATMAQ